MYHKNELDKTYKMDLLLLKSRMLGAPRNALVDDIGFQVVVIGYVIRLAPEAERPRFFEGLVIVCEQLLSIEPRRESAAPCRELEFVPLARGNVDIFSSKSGPFTVLHFV